MNAVQREANARMFAEQLNQPGVRAAAERAYAEDVVFVDMPDMPGGGEHRGREAAISRLEDFFQSWQAPRSEVVENHHAGDRIASRVQLQATGTASGVPAVLDHWWVGTYRGDRVVRVEVYLHREQALAALHR